MVARTDDDKDLNIMAGFYDTCEEENVYGRNVGWISACAGMTVFHWNYRYAHSS